jgi:hypothetical protein
MRRLETPPYEFALSHETRLRGLFELTLRDRRNQDANEVALRDAVCSLVRRAKDEGRQVETVIVALKDILGLTDRPRRTLGGDDDLPPAALLARRLVTWCIQEYYGVGPRVS